jgi:peptide/nickel transport system substrate-binding protein
MARVSRQPAILVTLFALALATLVLACTAVRAPEQGGTVASEAPPEQADPGEEAATARSRVGGALVIGVEEEPATLDPHKAVAAVASDILCWIGASLVTLDPQNNIVPYLAERWDTSEDGLTWRFHLKPGVHFHDGTLLTAQDYVYTFERALDPQQGTGVAGSLLGPVEAVRAEDEDTLVITLAEPFFPLLANLTACSYLMPLSQATVEARGDAFGRNPLSVGPYRFKEWRSGEVLVLERNPDFVWGPAFAQDGPYNVATVEYRFVPDATTELAALEAGELDVSEVAASDLPVLERSGHFTLHSAPLAGASPLGILNVSRPPFDDVRVRRAFNLAVNRDGLIQAVAQGRAEAQYGPLSASVLGYWPGVEEAGYPYDVEQAKALLEEAGYRMGAGGIREKDGQRLSVPLLTGSEFSRVAEVLQQQFEAIGVEVTIEVGDPGTISDRVLSDQYSLALISILFPHADILYLLFHSTDAALPVSHLSDPELDRLLENTRSTVDPAQRQAWVDQVQARIVEQAYLLPLYTPLRVTAVNERVRNLIVTRGGTLLFNDAYLIADAP